MKKTLKKIWVVLITALSIAAVGGILLILYRGFGNLGKIIERGELRRKNPAQADAEFYRELLKRNRPPEIDRIEMAIICLQNADVDNRAFCAKELGWSRDTRAVVPLIAALDDEHSDVRRAAAEALGNIAEALGTDDRVVKPLLVKLDDISPDVRKAALCALGNMGANGLTASLVVLTVDDDSGVRREAMRILGKFRNKRDLELVIEILTNALKDESTLVRWNTVRALGELGVRGNERVVEPLNLALKDNSPAVRKAAAEALYTIKDIKQ